MNHLKPILSVVFQNSVRDLSHFDYELSKWIEKGPPIPLNKYIGSGGHMTTDLQKAQVFGFSKHAKDRLDTYRKDPCYEVRSILIKET